MGFSLFSSLPPSQLLHRMMAAAAAAWETQLGARVLIFLVQRRIDAGWLGNARMYMDIDDNSLKTRIFFSLETLDEPFVIYAYTRQTQKKLPVSMFCIQNCSFIRRCKTQLIPSILNVKAFFLAI